MSEELQVTTVTKWTPDRAESVLVSADGGSMDLAADLVEAIMLDDRVAGVLATRVLALLGLPLIFEGSEQVLSALKGTGERDGDWWKMFPECELAKLLNWSVMLGLGVGELVDMGRDEETDRPIYKLKAWHPRFLKWSHQDQVWTLQSDTGTTKITPGDGKWILHTPGGYTRPWVNGAWRQLQQIWIAKQYVMRDWFRHCEAHGSPVRIGTSPEGASESQRQKFARDLKAIGRDAAIVLPAGYNATFLEASARTWETFQATIDMLNKAIEVVLVGQIVTTEGTMGFASGEVHENTRRELIKFTAESLATTLHEQGLKKWTEDNFGAAEKTPWVTWDVSPQEDRQAKAKTIEALGAAIAALDAGLAASGKRVDGEILAQQFAIPVQELPPSVAQAPTVTLTPGDVASIIKVNEGRASAGLGPLLLPNGAPDPDGELSIEEFKNKRAASPASLPTLAPQMPAGGLQ